MNLLPIDSEYTHIPEFQTALGIPGGRWRPGGVHARHGAPVLSREGSLQKFIPRTAPVMGQLCHVPVKRWMRKVLPGTGMHNKHRFASKNLLSAFELMLFALTIALQKHRHSLIVACEADKLTTQRPRHTLTAAVHVLPTWLVTAQEAQSASH